MTYTHDDFDPQDAMPDRPTCRICKGKRKHECETCEGIGVGVSESCVDCSATGTVDCESCEGDVAAQLDNAQGERDDADRAWYNRAGT